MSTDVTIKQAERLEAAVAEAREVLRDLHSASKDARQTLKEMRELLRSDIAEQMKAEVADQTRQLGEASQEAMRCAVEKVFHEFDKLGALLLGVDRAEPIEEMVRTVAAMPGGRRVEPYTTAATYDADVLGVHDA